jgi:D-beta-D-heptose 7-phosphate kinase/D-beta-D-heptose 1-phosphate adenosyltransferase
VLISDYDKGVIDEESSEFIIHESAAYNIPVIIDPKKKNWTMYSGAMLLTPNLKEFHEVCHRHHLDEKDLEGSGRAVRDKFKLENLLITLSENGMMLITKNDCFHIDTVKKEVFDVSGAGDTVIATLAACLASGLDIKSAVEIANIAAGIVVGKFGTAPVTLAELQNILDSRN